MPGPSAQCFAHEVSHTYQTWGQDLDGGRIVTATVTRQGYDCAVQPGEPQTEVQILPETGDRRVTFITPFKVLYPENPHLNVHDLILWTEEDSDQTNPPTHTIVVLGARNAAGLGSVWEVVGEERS
jgi:hypothetical protein